MTMSITEQRKAMHPQRLTLFETAKNRNYKSIDKIQKENSEQIIKSADESADKISEQNTEQENEIFEKNTKENETQANNEIQDDENKNKKTDFLQKISVILKNPADYKEYIEKMKELKQDTSLVQFKFGSLFYLIDKNFEESFDDSIKELFKDSNFKLIKKTQAFKYLKAYELCLNMSEVIQSTERLENLGIEKAYLITTLNNTEQTESLIKCTLNQNMTVKQLEYEIELLNRNLKENVNRAYDEVFAATKQKRLSTELSKLRNENKNSEQKPKTEQKIYTASQYKELEKKCNLLEQRNKELELKLQQYENAKMSSASEL